MHMYKQMHTHFTYIEEVLPRIKLYYFKLILESLEDEN